MSLHTFSCSLPTGSTVADFTVQRIVNRARSAACDKLLAAPRLPDGEVTGEAALWWAMAAGVEVETVQDPVNRSKFRIQTKQPVSVRIEGGKVHVFVQGK